MQFRKLLTEGRTEPIKEKVSNFDLTSDQLIFRGISGLSGYPEYAKIDPRQHSSREAKMNLNYYTLIINNASRWEKYPNRDLVCTTEYAYGDMYGKTYVVIPYDGTDWGICPCRSIWCSFSYADSTVGSPNNPDDSPVQVNKVISMLSKNLVGELPSQESFKKMKKQVNKIGKMIVENKLFEKYKDGGGPSNNRNDEHRLEVFSDLKEFWKSFQSSRFWGEGKLADYLIQIMDPGKNGFEYQFSWKGKVPKNRKVWTDKPCLFIKPEVVEEEFERSIG